MGWNASMIIIQNPENFSDEKSLLSSLGLDNYNFVEQTVLDECIYPNDDSISIGYYNNSIIICEGLKLMDAFITDVISYKERQLISLFPDSEILAIACISTINFHAYSLIDGGYKVRLKSIDADHGKTFDSGDLLKEEIEIFEKSVVENGVNYWKFEELPNELFTEDQMLEDFTFGVSKRLLGVKLDIDEGDLLFFEVPFRKYQPNSSANQSLLTSMKGSWIGYYEYGPLYGEEIYGKRVEFRLDLDDLTEGTFEGVCQDLEGIGSNKGLAKIKGFIKEHFISFTKEYDSMWMIDETGKEEPNDPRVLSSQLSYKGTYNPFRQEFTGEWEILSSIKFPDGSISEGIVYGTWAMKKG